MNRLMRHMGQEVVIHGRDGRIIEELWMDLTHQEGVFFRDRT